MAELLKVLSCWTALGSVDNKVAGSAQTRAFVARRKNAGITTSFKFLQRRHGRSGLSPKGGSYSRLPASLDWFDVVPLYLHQSALWKTAIRTTEPATLCQQSLNHIVNLVRNYRGRKYLKTSLYLRGEYRSSYVQCTPRRK